MGRRLRRRRVFSFVATLDENTQSPRRSSVMQYLDSNRAVEDLTVEFIAKMSSDLPRQPVGQVAIMPSTSGSVAGADWGTDPGRRAGCVLRRRHRPGLFVEWVASTESTIKKNRITGQRTGSGTSRGTFADRGSVRARRRCHREVDISDNSFAAAPTLTTTRNITLTNFDTSGVNSYSANQDPTKTSSSPT